MLQQQVMSSFIFSQLRDNEATTLFLWYWLWCLIHSFSALERSLDSWCQLAFSILIRSVRVSPAFFLHRLKDHSSRTKHRKLLIKKCRAILVYRPCLNSGILTQCNSCQIWDTTDIHWRQQLPFASDIRLKVYDNNAKANVYFLIFMIYFCNES